MTFPRLLITVAFQPVLPTYQLLLNTTHLYQTVCAHIAAAPPTQHALLHVSFKAAPRPPPCRTARQSEPNYKSAVECQQSNKEGSLTCMASIVSLTTMSGFTLAVNCPPLGSLAPSCRIFFCLFFSFRLPTDWEQSESNDSWLRFLSHMQPDTPN